MLQGNAGAEELPAGVAANILSIVQRELAQSGAADKTELEGPQKMLGKTSEKIRIRSFRTTSRIPA